MDFEELLKRSNKWLQSYYLKRLKELEEEFKDKELTQEAINEIAEIKDKMK